MEPDEILMGAPLRWRRRLAKRVLLLFSLVLLIVLGTLSLTSNAFVDLYLIESLVVLVLFMGAVGLLVWHSVQEIALEPLQRQLQQQREEIEKSNQARDEFMATMSHELRTPLTVILGSGELLAQSELNASQEKLLNSMDLSGRSLLYLINDILDLSKIDHGSFELNLAPFSMAELVGEMRQIFPRRASDVGIEFKATIYNPFGHQLIGDMQRIRQIMLNLCGNAVKFTGEGEVRLSVAQIERQPAREGVQWVRVVVEDDGIGMPPEVVEKLFKPFQQADSSISRRHGGTGLGLHISYKLIELMGGEIRVDSSAGIGSRFEVELPLQLGEVLEEELLTEKSSERRFYRGRVLVAEDTQVVQLLVRQILERYGLEVEIVENGQQALERGLAQSYGLILMDMQMPVMDGIEATTLLRQSFCQIPIVALTANVMQVHRNKFAAAGCDDFLSKPIEREELERVLEQFLEPMSAEEAAAVTLEPELEISDELKAVFLESTAQHQIDLGAALEQREWEMARLAAHNIKGSAANFGYPDLTDLAREVCDRIDQLADEADIVESIEALDRALTKAL